MENKISLNSTNKYQIKISGDIDAPRLKDFGAAEIRTEPGTGPGTRPTLFTIITDQSGLVGFVRQLHGLGLVLLSLTVIRTDTQ